MGNCHICQNVLPRTVDRCPVCSAAVPAAEPQTPDYTEVEPAWKAPTAAPSPAAESPGISPDEFLNEFIGFGDVPANDRHTPESVPDNNPFAGGHDPFAAGGDPFAQPAPAAPVAPEPTLMTPMSYLDPDAETEPTFERTDLSAAPGPSEWPSTTPAPAADPFAPADAAAFEAPSFEAPSFEAPSFEPQMNEPSRHEPQAFETFEPFDPAPVDAPTHEPQAFEPFDAASAAADLAPAPPLPPESHAPLDPPAALAPSGALAPPAALAGDSTAASSAVMPMAPPAPPPPSTPRPDPVSTEIQPRSVLASSNRIEGDIQLGASDRHLAKTVLAPIGAVILAGLGAFAGWGATTPDTLAFEQSEEVAVEDESTEAEEATAVEPEVEPEPVIDESLANLVQVKIDDCGTLVMSSGVVVDSTTVLTLARSVAHDTSPVIVTQDGRQIQSVVIGIDRETDLAVIQLAGPVDHALTWGTVGPLQAGNEVTVLAPDPAGFMSTDAVITEASRRTGMVEELEFAETPLLPGSAILNEDDFFIGIVDATGFAARTDVVLRPAMARILLEPSYPSYTCPAPEPVEDVEGGAGGETREN